jgi:hypothetical protein
LDDDDDDDQAETTSKNTDEKIYVPLKERRRQQVSQVRCFVFNEL